MITTARMMALLRLCCIGKSFLPMGNTPMDSTPIVNSTSTLNAQTCEFSVGSGHFISSGA